MSSSSDSGYDLDASYAVGQDSVEFTAELGIPREMSSSDVAGMRCFPVTVGGFVATPHGVYQATPSDYGVRYCYSGEMTRAVTQYRKGINWQPPQRCELPIVSGSEYAIGEVEVQLEDTFLRARMRKLVGFLLVEGELRGPCAISLNCSRILFPSSCLGNYRFRLQDAVCCDSLKLCNFSVDEFADIASTGEILVSISRVIKTGDIRELEPEFSGFLTDLLDPIKSVRVSFLESAQPTGALKLIVTGDLLKFCNLKGLKCRRGTSHPIAIAGGMCEVGNIAPLLAAYGKPIELTTTSGSPVLVMFS